MGGLFQKEGNMFIWIGCRLPVVDTFLLGLSETGEAGSFRVVRRIKI